MSLKMISAFLKPLRLVPNGLKISVTGTAAQERYRRGFIHPKKKYPPWFLKQERAKYDEMLTPESREFLDEMVCQKYGPRGEASGVKTYLHTPLKKEPVLRGTWFPRCRRSGLIGIKIGVMQQWFTDGKPCLTTLIQIVDNHVIKYIPPEEFVSTKKPPRRLKCEGKYGCLVVGAVNCDPQKFTKEYNGLFAAAGVMPKKLLTRFLIHPDAALQPGTPLYAAHFKVGDFIDVSGISMYRGFQGVMKRWGFHGQRASHGSTKTHRRPGNIGGGSKKANVWPGTKMPGVMGNKLRTMKGLRILRIDHEYNVIYVLGRSVPGDLNGFLYLHDTLLRPKRLTESPRFPTYYPEDYAENPIPDEEFVPNLFRMSEPTIMFEQEKAQKKK